MLFRSVSQSRYTIIASIDGNYFVHPLKKIGDFYQIPNNLIDSAILNYLINFSDINFQFELSTGEIMKVELGQITITNDSESIILEP